LSWNETPVGKVAPPSFNAALGNAEVITVNVPGEPTVNVAVARLVKLGAESTVSVKVCEVVPEPFVALMVIVYVPPVPAAGVPLKVAVPGVNVTPVGSVPVSVYVGDPVAVAVNDPDVPTVNVVLVALVNAGVVFTVRVKT